ncbi:hypothetical protein DNTS_022725 [Danionella cerebrum]|uniref:Ig-like domain-containing protein n=1 Tax=Danionella cerebrum TaxID=2873325 RepID=A0A553MY11_9TELE|nr:hypothetical protein DNTS_022725 [Danionella translucida]
MMDVNGSVHRGLFCVFLGLLLLSGSVSTVSVKAPAELSVIRGSTAKLQCSFSSTHSHTSAVSIDWSFKEKGTEGDRAKLFFHFSSRAYPPQDPGDQFFGRIIWMGNPSKGDASIHLINASIHDNGTFICTVINPPDINGQQAQITLTVTHSRLTLALTDVSLLLLVVCASSALAVLILMIRIFCCRGHKNKEEHALSPIELLPGEEYFYGQKEDTHSFCCCYFKGYESDDDFKNEKQHEHTLAESCC